MSCFVHNSRDQERNKIVWEMRNWQSDSWDLCSSHVNISKRSLEKCTTTKHSREFDPQPYNWNKHHVFILSTFIWQIPFPEAAATLVMCDRFLTSAASSKRPQRQEIGRRDRHQPDGGIQQQSPAKDHGQQSKCDSKSIPQSPEPG